jgi:radical SAM protein with 4Fe4S-binding SPASM domain
MTRNSNDLDSLKDLGLKSLSIQLTKKCNLDCVMCGQAVSRKIRKERALLSKHTLLQVFKDGKKLGADKMILTGGEPTTHPELEDIVRLSKSMGFTSELMTNGILLTRDFSKALIDAGLDGITISIQHSNSKLHDKVTRIEGSWKMAIEAIKCIKELDAKFPVSFFFTVSRSNYRDSMRIMLLAKSIGVSRVTFSHIVFSEPHVDKKLGLSEHQMDEFYYLIAPALLYTGKTMGIEVILNPSFLGMGNMPTEEHAFEMVRNSEKFKKDIDNFSKGLYGIGRCNKYACTTALTSSRIQANGEVTICCDSEPADFSLGNVNKRRFMEIWNSEKYRKIRDIYYAPKFPGCVVCKRDFDPHFELKE